MNSASVFIIFRKRLFTRRCLRQKKNDLLSFLSPLSYHPQRIHVVMHFIALRAQSWTPIFVIVCSPENTSLGKSSWKVLD